MLFDSLQQLLKTYKKYNTILSARKSKLYTQKVRRCGVLIDKISDSLDPNNNEAIQNMYFPFMID